MPIRVRKGWEAELLALMRAGCSRIEAAGRIGISIVTVNSRIRRNPALGDAVRAATIAAGPGGIHADEDFDDTCCRRACERLGIWYVDGRAYCPEHWSVYRSNTRRTVGLLERGLCTCGRPAAVGNIRKCHACVDVQAKRVARYIEQGLCMDCGKPKERVDIKRCDACHARNSAYYWSRKEKKQLLNADAAG